jgi:aminopeptidase N
VEKTVGETTVRSWYWPGGEAGAERVLESGAESLELYAELIGPYPYEEMDLVQMDIGNGAGGVEFPGLMYIGSSFYNENWGGDPLFLEFIVVHEVAHQWFYNIIGNNQYQHAFIDESISNYLSIVYFADAYGSDVARQQANRQLRLSYFNLLFQQGDQIVDTPTDDFPTSSDYGIIVYCKGALGFQYLRAEIGADAFFAGLSLYYQRFAFAVGQPADMLAAFEEASETDLGDFWTHWFESPNGEQDFDATDLANVLRELDE